MNYQQKLKQVKNRRIECSAILFLSFYKINTLWPTDNSSLKDIFECIVNQYVSGFIGVYTMVDAEILEPVKITDTDKEIFIENFEKSLLKLSAVLNSTENADSSQAEYVNKIAVTIKLLKYNQDNTDPRENTGIYNEIEIDRRFGFPSLETMVLFSSKAASAEKELHRLGKKRDAARTVIDVLSNREPSEESVQDLYLANDRIREIDFYNRLKTRDYADLPTGVSSKIIDINLIDENNQIENFALFFAGWDLAKGFFCSYAINLFDDKEKYMRLGPEKPGHIFKNNDSKSWQISGEVKSVLASSLGLHPQHYFLALNKLEGIHPKKICYLGIEGFESKHSSKNFKDIIARHQETGILTATLITLMGKEETGSGKTRQTKVDLEKDASAALFVICSEETKSEVMEYYKHNKYIDYQVIPY